MMDTIWQVFIAIVIVTLSALVILKLYLNFIKGKCTSKADLSGKVAIVTGANTGIGYFTALDLARRNARVILACRNLKKGQEAVEKIRSETGNKDVVVIALDVSLMKSVREFAQQINKQERRLDILVNNAGVTGLPLTKTEEGFEVTFATNYFGHFLLTNLLLDLLKKSQPSRVVNVSSIAHRWSKGINFDNLKAEMSYSMQFYFDSKLANILFTRELARRTEGSGVTCYSVHPGTIKTEIWRNMTFLFNLMVALPKLLYFKTAEEGAQTSIYCAVSEDLAGVSGRYYEDCKEAEDQSSDMSKDMGVAKKLWEISEKYTGLADENEDSY